MILTSIGTSGVGLPLVFGIKNKRPKQTMFITAKIMRAMYLLTSYSLFDRAPRNEPEIRNMKHDLASYKSCWYFTSFPTGPAFNFVQTTKIL